jgi:hypothetical protein
MRDAVSKRAKIMRTTHGPSGLMAKLKGKVTAQTAQTVQAVADRLLGQIAGADRLLAQTPVGAPHPLAGVGDRLKRAAKMRLSIQGAGHQIRDRSDPLRRAADKLRGATGAASGGNRVDSLSTALGRVSDAGYNLNAPFRTALKQSGGTSVRKAGYALWGLAKKNVGASRLGDTRTVLNDRPMAQTKSSAIRLKAAISSGVADRLLGQIAAAGGSPELAKMGLSAAREITHGRESVAHSGHGKVSAGKLAAAKLWVKNRGLTTAAGAARVVLAQAPLKPVKRSKIKATVYYKPGK